MTDRYENIRLALANGPTSGPWEPVTDRQYSDLPYLVLGAGASDAKSAEWMPLYVHVGGRSGWMEQKANTLLIAACDPDTIRELLAERDQLAAEIEALRAEVDALRLNAASVQPELVAVALAACDAVDDLIEKWYATRESGCLPNQVVRARGASKLLRAIALEGTK